MSSTIENVDDMLSMLPGEVLSRILSLMPTKYAVRTSVLSKRWRYTWTSVTNLDFDYTRRLRSNENIITKFVDGNEKNFIKFVDRALKFCKTSNVELFRLHVSNYHHAIGSSVSNWIDNAVRLNVRELDICVLQSRLPLSVFTCKTLTNLRLELSVCDYCVWEFPSSIYLPCLKTLELVGYCNPFIEVFNFIRGCPVLESLSLEVSSNDEEDYIFNIPTLKRLKLIYISATDCYENKIVLHVPKLEYLFVGGVLCSFFEMKDVSSLVGASIACWQSTSDFMWADILNKITGVQNLSIEIFPFTSPLPIFSNMKQLELKGTWESGQIIQFLESCPELKILSIDFVDWRDFKVLKIPRASPHCEIRFRTWKSPPPQEFEDDDPYEGFAF